MTQISKVNLIPTLAKNTEIYVLNLNTYQIFQVSTLNTYLLKLKSFREFLSALCLPKKIIQIQVPIPNNTFNN